MRKDYIAPTAEVVAIRMRVAQCSKHCGTAESSDRCFGSCVNPYACNPSSHGCITRTEYCRCGAERLKNINGKYSEVGRWYCPV